MKRYIIFGYDQYYPMGGWSDKIGEFDNLEEAKYFQEKSYNRSEGFQYYDQIDIVDLFDGNVVD